MQTDSAGLLPPIKFSTEDYYRVILDPECNETDVRLVDGPAANTGRVEICLNGVWGSVCVERYWWHREHWDIREARVVCRQLGYDGCEFFSRFPTYKNLLYFSTRVSFTTAAVSRFFVKCVCCE